MSGGRLILIEPDYRGHRIEVYADGLQGQWNAVVRICALSDGTTHIERVTCRQATPDLAEQKALVWGKTWVG
jgi:hypothetical protein